MNYIEKVLEQTPTRLWINNPTQADLDKALQAGAINGTSNPSYCSKLLQREPEFIIPIIDDVVDREDDDLEAAAEVYQRATKRFMEAFMPIYEASNGASGYVTMQDFPCRDEDSDAIVETSLRQAQVAPNFMAKIPVTEAGMRAMERLIERDIPICATECFALAQTTAMCELYEKAAARSGNRPPLYITHITGIFDEGQADYVRSKGIDIDPDVLEQAGSIVARKEYRVIKERGYHTTMLGGGARGLQHFTNFVGGDVHITLNWSTIRELIEQDPPVASRIDEQAPEGVVEELRQKLPDFRHAYDDVGLKPWQFRDFPPVIRFRTAFVRGFTHLLDTIGERREALKRGAE